MTSIRYCQERESKTKVEAWNGAKNEADPKTQDRKFYVLAACALAIKEKESGLVPQFSWAQCLMGNLL